jgi:hypothetical protein
MRRAVVAGRSIRRRLAWTVLAALLLVNCGCLVAAAGAAAGGAAAVGYLYYKDQSALYRDYPASLEDSAAAVRTALHELQFPPLPEEKSTNELVIYTRSADGNKVRIRLEVLPHPIPVERPSTRISVGVGLTGDDAVSARILDQVSRHLVPAGAPGASPGATLGPPSVPETAPPPLAPPVAPARISGLEAPPRAP